MRDLVSHAALGTPGRWKVYIVDEVHMLSNAAANALLKTLEEPPGHVVFVLATTDPQKVPATIRSRTQHFEFRLIGPSTLHDLLEDVRDRAGLALDDDALAAAVRRGRGSARDALSALDQVAASGSAAEVRPGLTSVTEAVCSDDASAVLIAMAALHDAGWGPQQLATELVDDLRQGFLVTLAPDLADVTESDRDRLADQARRLGLPRLVRAIELLGRAQVDMRDAPDPRVVFEIALVRLARPELDDDTASLVERVTRLERNALHPRADAPSTPSPPEIRPIEGDAERTTIGAYRRQREQRVSTLAKSAPEVVVDEPAAPRAPSATHDESRSAPPSVESPQGASGVVALDRDELVKAWGDVILKGLGARAKALYSGGRFVEVRESTVVFALPNAAHRDRCAGERDIVEAAVGTHFGTPVVLELIVEAAPGAKSSPAARPTHGEAARKEQFRSAPVDDDADEPFDLDEVFDPDDVAVDANSTTAELRLLEAFPGAEEVSE
jgi:DNA polymerase III subunit gamma/tau